MTDTVVGHVHDEADDKVYAGRGNDEPKRTILNTPIGENGWLGNPFPTEDYDRTQSVALYRRWFEYRIVADAEFREAVADLAGSTLVCWCQSVDESGPQCHAEVIAEWADMLARRDGE